jgi:hypothetical protein
MIISAFMLLASSCTAMCMRTDSESNRILMRGRTPCYEFAHAATRRDRVPVRRARMYGTRLYFQSAFSVRLYFLIVTT